MGTFFFFFYLPTPHGIFLLEQPLIRLSEVFLFFFILRLNVPVNNFSVLSGRSHRFLGFRELMCLAQGHNTVTLEGIKPRTSRFRVQCSTTRQPCFLFISNRFFSPPFLFMPPTLKKLEGHIAFGLSVCVCVCGWVGASVNF